MVKRPYVPVRGDVVWVDFDPTKGHEQRGKRPAVVLSPKAYNQAAGLMLACPVTSNVKGYPFETLIKAGPIDGVALVDQVRSLDWRARHVKKAVELPEHTLHEIQKKLHLLLL